MVRRAQFAQGTGVIICLVMSGIDPWQEQSCQWTACRAGLVGWCGEKWCLVWFSLHGRADLGKPALKTHDGNLVLSRVCGRCRCYGLCLAAVVDRLRPSQAEVPP